LAKIKLETDLANKETELRKKSDDTLLQGKDTEIEKLKD